MLPDDIKNQLEQPLDPSVIRQREQAGVKLAYIEAWYAVAKLNEILGHGGWHRETLDVTLLTERSANDKWHVSYRARVRLTITAGDAAIVRDGCGAGHGVGKHLGECHESALKEAESDALKRAASTLGWPLGLALYDSSRAHVGNGEGNGGGKNAGSNGAQQAEKYRFYWPNGDLAHEFPKTKQGFAQALAEMERAVQSEHSLVRYNRQWLEQCAQATDRAPKAAERAQAVLNQLDQPAETTG